MAIVMRSSCWHQNFGPNGLSAIAQGLCLNFFSSVTTDFNISSALRLVIQDQWSSGLQSRSVTDSQLNTRVCVNCTCKLAWWAVNQNLWLWTVWHCQNLQIHLSKVLHLKCKYKIMKQSTCENKVRHVVRKPVYAICEQQRRRSACTFAQTDQHLCCSLPRYYNITSSYICNFMTLACFCGWAGRCNSLSCPPGILSAGTLYPE